MTKRIDKFGLKEFLRELEKRHLLRKVPKRLSTSLEVSSVLYSCQDTPILFENVSDSSYKIGGNLYGTVELLKIGLGLEKSASLVEFVQSSISGALDPKGRFSSFEKSSWDYSGEADLSELPILKHFDLEAGKYITAGVVVAKFPGTNEENLSVHRMLILSKNKVATRIVPRHLSQIAKDAGKRVPISVLIGPPPPVFLAASLQTSYGLSEYKIANKMMNGRLELVASELSDIAFPKDSEMVLEGYLDPNEQVNEGPFVDLTGTYDETRKQSVITFQRMHTRKDSVYQAIVASSREHAIFMGLPQELKISEALSKSVPKVRGVHLTGGSRGYFHCVVSLEKSNDGDGKTAILNCFAASHPLKLVVAVDSDVDPFDLSQVEWALATRFQADKGLIRIDGARGSSLDPSSGKLAITSKIGLDATLPMNLDKTKFVRASVTLSETARAVLENLGFAPAKSESSFQSQNGSDNVM